MRIAGLLLGAILCAGAPADAGIRATYTLAGEPAPLVVEIDDNGATRLEVTGSNFYFLVIGHSAYVIGRNMDDGRRIALRAEDVAPAMWRAGIKIQDDGTTPFPGAPSLPPQGFKDLGRTSVAGIPGHRYGMIGTSSQPLGVMSILTIADDPALRRGGEAIGTAVATIILPLMPLIEGEAPKQIGWIRQMLPFLERGLPLSFDTDLVLRELKSDAVIAPTQMALPGPPATAAELDRLIAEHAAGE